MGEPDGRRSQHRGASTSTVQPSSRFVISLLGSKALQIERKASYDGSIITGTELPFVARSGPKRKALKSLPTVCFLDLRPSRPETRIRRLPSTQYGTPTLAHRLHKYEAAFDDSIFSKLILTSAFTENRQRALLSRFLSFSNL